MMHFQIKIFGSLKPGINIYFNFNDQIDIVWQNSFLCLKHTMYYD